MSWRANGGYFGPRPTGPSTSLASGWWDSRSQFRNRRAGQWPTNGDPFWSDVILLLSMDGSNGSTTIVDSGPNAFSVTANGTAAISTAQAKFGQSLLCGGSGNHISIPQNDAFNFGSGDFTVEAWLYITAFNSLSFRFLATRNPVNFTFEVNNAGRLQTWDGATVRTWGTTGDVSLNTWHHIAFVRSGSSFVGYLDGLSKGTFTTTRTYTLSSDIQFPTTLNDNSGTGHIDELRVTKAARYTAAFTPSTLPFPTTA